MRGVHVALLGIFLAGCGGDGILLSEDLSPEAATAEVRASAGAGFELRIGEVAALRDADLLIGFRGVRSDSRCPADVTCVWAGDAVLAIGIARDGGSWSWYDLHTTLEPQEIATGEYRIRLVELRPATDSRRRMEPGEYRAVLEIVPA